MSDRHEKWVKVEPGTVIPAGQPYAVEYLTGVMKWAECVNESYSTKAFRDPAIAGWFVDSSWRPPLELPTEPTWGIAVHKTWGRRCGVWSLNEAGTTLESDPPEGWWQGVASTVDFIPLTDEQIARIEAAR